MNKIYLHSNNHKNSLNKLMLYLFIPFLIYGFYKNGIKLYNNEYIGFLGMFKPLLTVAFSIIITYVFSKINKEEFMGYRLVSNILIAMICSPQLNLILYLIILLVLNVSLNFVKFNIVPVFMIINIILMKFLPGEVFLNSLESSVVYNYSVLDYLLGKGIGGISNTLLLMSLISLVILILNMGYKKQIPIMAFIIYYILITIYAFISSNASVDLFLNNNVIFAYIFVCNLSIYTPYSKGACYIYGLLLGLLTFAFSFIDINLGVYIVVMVLGFLSPLFDRFIVGKTNKNLVEVL